MEYRRLGSTGVLVSVVGLGGNSYGHYCDEARTAEVIHRALDLGINHIDTADVYARTRSEDHVGKAIAGRRTEVVLATKVGYPLGHGPNDSGLSYRRIIACCENSLRRLGTDYIDLYYMHIPDPRTKLEETLRAFDDLVRQGKVRYVGMSNYRAWQICEALWISDRRGYQPPVVSQSEFSLLARNVQEELIPFCRAHEVGIVPYQPLAGGLLTGKYRRGEEIQPGVRAYDNVALQRQLTEANFALVDRLANFAHERGHTPGDLAIAWLMAHAEVSSIIAGATKHEQVEANVAAADWKLTPEDLAAIEDILVQ